MKQFTRFLLVGTSNTAVGYSVIFAALAFGLSPYVSNILGYGVGLVCSFFLNKTFVFRAKGGLLKRASLFLSAFLVAYGANFVALYILLEAGVGPITAQIIAGVVYTTVMYNLSRKRVFK